MAISENDRHDAFLRDPQSPVAVVEKLTGTVRRRAALIGIVTVVCAAFGLAYILLPAPKYVASGRILLDPQGLQIAGTGVAPRGARDISAIEAESQIYVITSRSVFDRVIDREKLDTNPLFGAKSRGLLSTLLVGVGLVRPVDSHVMALRQLDRAVSVSRSADSFVFNVNVATTDRDTSERVANAIMDAYIEEEARAQAETARRAGATLDARLEALQGRLREAEERYEKYRSEKGLVIVSGQPLIEKQAGEFASQITAAEARVNELRASLDQIQRVRSGSPDLDALPEAFRGGAIETLKNRYAAAKQTEVNLAATLGRRHPDLIAAATQTAEARRRLDQAIRDMIQSNTIELERARAVVAGLKSRLEASKKDLGGSNEAAIRLRELEREVEASRSIYQAFLVRSRELGEQQRFDNSNTRIVSRATRPLEPAGAPAILVLLASLLFGFGAGVSLAWLLDQLDDTKKKAALR